MTALGDGCYGPVNPSCVEHNQGGKGVKGSDLQTAGAAGLCGINVVKSWWYGVDLLQPTSVL